MGKTADRLRVALTRNHELALRLDQDTFPIEAFNRLQDWQRARLSRSYTDLSGDPLYRDATRFFLTELYGGLNFRERDREVERVLPVMVRTLPDHMLATLAEAFELQALSLEFDMSMAAVMTADETHQLDLAAYGKIYRRCGRQQERRRQIEMIRRLGEALNLVVHNPFVLWLVRLLRGPARAAGFGTLQDFLESGLSAFQAMKSADSFVPVIYEREIRSMEALFEGDPEPFQSSKVQPNSSRR